MPPKKKKAKVKKIQSRISKKLPLLLGTLAIVVLFAFGAIYLYLKADALVVRSLAGQNLTKQAAIYSEPFMVFQGTKYSEPALRRQLAKRLYIETAGAPQSAGEFRIANQVLDIYNREFLLPNGTTKKNGHVLYNFQNGDIINLDSSEKKELLLEPVVIAPLGGGDLKAQRYKTLNELPPFLPRAFLAIEDQRFYQHFGIDPVGILRAVVTNLIAMKVVQGGSTITQQLAKNLLFTSQRTFSRKIGEAFAALSLERHLSKDKILERYLNEVYFGRDGAIAIHGVSEASRAFLGKEVEDINLSEAALLAGLVKAPSALAIRKHLERAVERRDLVLQAMVESNMISKSDYDRAKRSKIHPADEGIYKRIAPHFIAAVDSSLNEKFDVEAAIGGGLAVFTGMDREMQECADMALTTGLSSLEKKYPSLKRADQPLEGSLVALEPYSGLVKAWVGGRDFGKNQFNHVSQAKRQIGSTIKPFVYLTALSPQLNSYKVATAVSILADEPIEIPVAGGVWSPDNYDNKFRGDVTLRYALENSLNIPAVYLSQKVGIHAVVNTLQRFRVGKNIPALPSIALGAIDTTLLDLVAAYGALANNGVYVEPRLYSSVLSGDNSIALSQELVEEPLVDEASVYVLTNIMQGVIERGTARSVRTGGFTGTAAGKTGTTNEARDAWFIGYTPSLAAGVWVGYDDNRKIGLTGGVAAAPIWTEFMKCVAPYTEDLTFLQPPGVTYKAVDRETFSVVSPDCPTSGSTFQEVFVAGTEPLEECRREAIPYNEPTEEEFIERPRGDKPSLSEEYELEQRQKQRKNSGWFDSLFDW